MVKEWVTSWVKMRSVKASSPLSAATMESIHCGLRLASFSCHELVKERVRKGVRSTIQKQFHDFKRAFPCAAAWIKSIHCGLRPATFSWHESVEERVTKRVRRMIES
jgi:hypothetical protein